MLKSAISARQRGLGTLCCRIYKQELALCCLISEPLVLKVVSTRKKLLTPNGMDTLVSFTAGTMRGSTIMLRMGVC